MMEGNPFVLAKQQSGSNLECFGTQTFSLKRPRNHRGGTLMLLKLVDASPAKVSRRRRESESPKAGPSPEAVRALTSSLAQMVQSCPSHYHLKIVVARHNSRRS